MNRANVWKCLSLTPGLTLQVNLIEEKHLTSGRQLKCILGPAKDHCGRSKLIWGESVHWLALLTLRRRMIQGSVYWFTATPFQGLCSGKNNFSRECGSGLEY